MNTYTSSIEVKWKVNEVDKCSLNKYTVKWVPADGGCKGVMDVSHDTSNYTIHGLNADTKYSITVTAATSDGKQTNSDNIIQKTNNEGKLKYLSRT